MNHKKIITGCMLSAIAGVALLMGEQSTHAAAEHAPSIKSGPSEHEDRQPAAKATPTSSGEDESRPSKDDEEEIEIQFAKSRKPAAVRRRPQFIRSAQADETPAHSPTESHTSTESPNPVGSHHESSEGEPVHASKAVAKNSVASSTEPKIQSPGFFHRLTTQYGDAFLSIQSKVDELKNAVEENKRLRLENANLRVLGETLKYSCRSEAAEQQFQRVGKKLSAETGTKVGRTLASIRYQIPDNLMPEQLLALGVSYFKVGDDEKSVTIFNFLTDMEDEDAFKTPENFLMAGIAWYRLENYKLADQYFTRVLKESESSTNQQAQIQARIWKALVAQRNHNVQLAQKFLIETVEAHPHSTEARWVNPQEGDRVPAGHSAHDTDESETVPHSKH